MTKSPLRMTTKELRGYLAAQPTWWLQTEIEGMREWVREPHVVPIVWAVRRIAIMRLIVRRRLYALTEAALSRFVGAENTQGIRDQVHETIQNVFEQELSKPR